MYVVELYRIDLTKDKYKQPEDSCEKAQVQLLTVKREVKRRKVHLLKVKREMKRQKVHLQEVKKLLTLMRTLTGGIGSMSQMNLVIHIIVPRANLAFVFEEYPTHHHDGFENTRKRSHLDHPVQKHQQLKR